MERGRKENWSDRKYPKKREREIDKSNEARVHQVEDEEEGEAEAREEERRVGGALLPLLALEGLVQPSRGVAREGAHEHVQHQHCDHQRATVGGREKAHLQAMVRSVGGGCDKMKEEREVKILIKGAV